MHELMLIPVESIVLPSRKHAALSSINAQSFAKDVASVRPGGYLVYDSTRPLHHEQLRPDIHFLGIPMTAAAFVGSAETAGNTKRPATVAIAPRPISSSATMSSSKMVSAWCRCHSAK